MTAQKKAVVEAFCKAGPIHPTAETVYMLAKQTLPSIALGTVYRNLSKMVEAGELIRLSVPDGPDRYDIDLSPHMHIFCIDCGKIYDIDESKVTVTVNDLPEGVELVRYDFVGMCRCSRCRAAKSN